jgi:hypothetical protein
MADDISVRISPQVPAANRPVQQLRLGAATCTCKRPRPHRGDHARKLPGPAWALRFAPIRSFGFSMSCRERAVNWQAAGTHRRPSVGGSASWPSRGRSRDSAVIPRWFAAGNEALTSAASAICWADGQAKAVSIRARHLAATAADYANVPCPGDGDGQQELPGNRGIKIVDRTARPSGLTSRPLGLGPPAGGSARNSGPARYRRVRETVTLPVVPR